jgi:hypothetical protein
MKILVGLLMLVTFGICAQAQEAKVIAELAASAEQVVKNSPFSADAVSESVQTLADGNRIVHSSTSKLYRNSEGRFRREMTAGSGAAPLSWTYAGGPEVTILDPVAGLRFQLDSAARIANSVVLRAMPEIKIATAMTDSQKAELEQKLTEARAKGQFTDVQKLAAEKAIVDSIKASTMIAPAAVVGPVEPRLATAPVSVAGISGGVGYAVGVGFGVGNGSKFESRTEELGTQNIEGVEAEGTRRITTIPAGAIGNDRPIETVYERWYSKELQLVVMSKTSDPRFGEQTYTLKNIVRSEPDPALFTVPQGYRIVSDAGSVYRLSAAKAELEKAAAAKPAQGAVTYVKNKP